MILSFCESSYSLGILLGYVGASMLFFAVVVPFKGLFWCCGYACSRFNSEVWL